MGLQLRNTLTGEVEPFEPRGETVGLYYCGLTVSDRAHLGHARSWVHVDVLRRWLEHGGHRVRHIENFTDVNEKIVARVGAREGWDDERAVAEHFIGETLTDMRRLNLLRASAYPRVTEHIGEIIALIERLVDAGHAYAANGSVYFDVPAFADYGQLVEVDLEAGPTDDPDKRHPADFALWKADGVATEDLAEHVKDPDIDPDAAGAGALTWDSPWGEGRPGWHIECSAMSMTHLGETFDIHVAGRDIAFPHNENEIAQSEAATGEPYARHWLHVDLLEIDEEKMSSSLENFLTVERAVDRYGPNVVRTFLLSASHATRQAYSVEALDEAQRRWERLERAYRRAEEVLDGPSASATGGDEALRAAVDEARSAASSALDANLDTRGALVALEGLARAVLVHIDERHPPRDYVGLLDAVATLDEFGGRVLGFEFARPGGAVVLDRVLDRLLDHREALREAGAFDEADALRAALAEVGVEIEDTDAGPRVHLVE